jgi:peptide/nickel transport system permease protein
MNKKKNIGFIIGAIVTGLMLLVAIISIFYTPYDPEKMDI